LQKLNNSSYKKFVIIKKKIPRKRNLRKLKMFNGFKHSSFGQYKKEAKKTY